MIRNTGVRRGDNMKLSSKSFAEGARIPVEFAFGKIDSKNHVALSSNRNPQLSWTDAPVGTKSFAIICHDPDVPSSGDDVNKEGRVVPASLPRVDFYHWVLIDLPAGVTSVAAGEFGEAVVPKGRPGPAAKHGARHGINDFTSWFAEDREMSGDYYGYDGPCPPWNDAIIHRYVFTVYAIDVDRVPSMGKLNGSDALKVIERHKLGQASITGTYTLNPKLA
jgi:Raf kinase inhibitor-like YbhB/YbcL family protein